MSESDGVDGGRDTREAIMRATYSALCEHGYADLTTKDIADESETSTAALHYHYDTKADLLLAFLDRLYDDFTDEYAETPGDDAVERLVAFAWFSRGTWRDVDLTEGPGPSPGAGSDVDADPEPATDD